MPFKEDLDKCPIDVLADKYGGGGASFRKFESVISTEITVLTAAKTLDELLINEETAVVDEDTGVAPDGVTWWFAGVISPHPEMQIKPTTVEFTSATLTVNDDGNGNLSAAGVTGTIDYDTGAWTISCDAAPPVGANWVVDYTWRFRLPAKVNGLWLTPAGDVRATFAPGDSPTSSTGTLIAANELFDLLLGQPTMIKDAKFIAAASTVVSIDVLV